MSEQKAATLETACVVTAGRIEATVNLPRGSVRFITRDQYGLERGSCEMFMAEWAAIGDALMTVAAAFAKQQPVSHAESTSAPATEGA